MAMMQPRRHAANLEFTTACRNTQEEDFLPGRMNVARQQSRKQFWQPRATGKDICATGDRNMLNGFNVIELSLALRRNHSPS